MLPALPRVFTVALAVIALAGCSGSSDSDEPAAGPSTTAKAENAALPSPSAGAAPLPTATPDPSLVATGTAEATAESTTEVAPADELSAAQRALVDRLKPDVVSDCKGNAKAEGDDVSAAVTCTGAGGLVLAFSFPSTEAMARAVDQRATGLPVKQGKCSQGADVRDDWQFRQVTQGELLCRNVDGKQVVFYSQYDQLVGFQVEGEAPAGGYQTWMSFEPI